MIRLTDGQWERIRNHFAEENIPDGRPGRKPVSTRRVLEAVLWILNTGAQWHMLPQSYPNYKTVHRRFQTWCREVLRRVLTDVANELRNRGAVDEEECFIDATFVMAKGGGAERKVAARSYRNAGTLAIAARTCATDHIPPRGAEIPRSFNSFAIERSEFAPAVRMSSMTGARSAARDFAARDLARRALAQSAAVPARPRNPRIGGSGSVARGVCGGAG